MVHSSSGQVRSLRDGRLKNQKEYKRRFVVRLERGVGGSLKTEFWGESMKQARQRKKERRELKVGKEGLWPRFSSFLTSCSQTVDLPPNTQQQKKNTVNTHRAISLETKGGRGLGGTKAILLEDGRSRRRKQKAAPVLLSL